MVGQSEGAVRKARDRQSIVEGITTEGKYIPSIASEEWGKPILKEFLSSENINDLYENVVEAEETVLKPKKEKQNPTTSEEFIKEIMSEPLPKVSKKDIALDTDTELNDSSTKIEAERKTAILKSKMLGIAYQEKKGDLIPRSKINSVLFSYGAEIRVAVEGITNRVLDDMLAVSEDRSKAKRILDEEIYKTLNSIADNERILL